MCSLHGIEAQTDTSALTFTDCDSGGIIGYVSVMTQHGNQSVLVLSKTIYFSCNAIQQPLILHPVTKNNRLIRFIYFYQYIVAVFLHQLKEFHFSPKLPENLQYLLCMPFVYIHVMSTWHQLLLKFILHAF